MEWGRDAGGADRKCHGHSIRSGLYGRRRSRFWHGQKCSCPMEGRDQTGTSERGAPKQLCAGCDGWAGAGSGYELVAAAFGSHRTVGGLSGGGREPVCPMASHRAGLLRAGLSYCGGASVSGNSICPAAPLCGAGGCPSFFRSIVCILPRKYSAGNLRICDRMFSGIYL